MDPAIAVTLLPGQGSTVIMKWTSPAVPSVVTLKASVRALPGETDIADNSKTIVVTVK